MSETILSRKFHSMPVEATGSSLPIQVDTLTSRFLEEATDPKVLAAMTTGSFAYRIGRGAVLGWEGLHPLGFLRQPLSIALGFGSEVSAFEFTNRLLETFRATAGRPTNQSPNLWSWSGPEGWKRASPFLRSPSAP